MNKLDRIGILSIEILDDTLKTFSDGVQFSDYKIIPRIIKRGQMIYNLVIEGVLREAKPEHYSEFSEKLTLELFQRFPVMTEDAGEFGIENAKLFMTKLKNIVVKSIDMGKDGFSYWEGIKILPSVISLGWTTKEAYKELKDLNTEETSEIVGQLALEITDALK